MKVIKSTLKLELTDDEIYIMCVAILELLENNCIRFSDIDGVLKLWREEINLFCDLQATIPNFGLDRDKLKLRLEHVMREEKVNG